MMKYFTSLLLFTIFLLPQIINAQSNGQPEDPTEIVKAISYHDSIFWQAYNVCDVEKMDSYLTEDLEFYHDKGGPTFTLINFSKSVRSGLCGNPNWRLRREAIQGTVKVFPMNNYGGLISGEHIFYINETGKEEILDGYGKFTQLWQFKNNEWKMSRVLSYDHGPAPYINKRKEVAISSALLKQFSGKYESPQAGSILISIEGSRLKLSGKNFEDILYPESDNKFFLKERDLQFEFIKEKNKITKMLIYEKGNIVEEAKKI